MQIARQRQQACYERAADLVAELNRKAPEKSIGILTRTNRGVAQLIFMLENLGVEVSQEGGNPLTDGSCCRNNSVHLDDGGASRWMGVGNFMPGRHRWATCLNLGPTTCGTWLRNGG